MATLSSAEIRNYASNAGFTGDDLTIAVAVALAESGGNTDSHNTKAPDNSYGLWQINMYGNLGPARRLTYHLANNDALFDPAINARVAYGVFKANGWKAWTTYTTGKYKSFLDNRSIGETIKDGLVDTVGASDIAASISSVGKNLFNGIASIIAVLVAITLLVVGFAILMRDHLPTKKLAKAAIKKVGVS